MSDRITYTPAEAAAALGLSVASIRKLYLDPNSGLVALRAGGSVLITREAIDTWLAGLKPAR